MSQSSSQVAAKVAPKSGFTPICSANLGVDAEPPKFTNGIEFTISIRDHDPAYSYNIKRTKEAKYHRTSGDSSDPARTWEEVTRWNKPAGTSDDAHDSDECLTPQASGSVHKIFSTDAPGWPSMTSTYNAYLQKINFIEFVRIARSDGTFYDDPFQQNWHTTLMIEKTGGVWAINTLQSEIGPRHLPSLDP